MKKYGEKIEETCSREDPTLTAKKVPLYGGCNRGVAKYGYSFNTRSHGKNYKPIRKESMKFKTI